MATPSHAHAVKSLNKSSGRQRFVFKTFSQRLQDIDVNVYKNLEKIKTEPSEGSSFFRDCLMECRELNTAEDFISFYEEVMLHTQTLPLVLVHKESLMSKLISRLNMKARLSLEPILRLIAALSRDLLEEFVPLLPRIVDSLVFLLESGADRESEIIEQIFTSWSYVMMYLQKYLVQDTSLVLKVTAKLRFYPKEYVREFMAESMSFVLRNAQDEQLRKGLQRIMIEAVQEPSECREFGAQALFYHIMRRSSSRFHSKAGRVLQFLTCDDIYDISANADHGSCTILNIVKSVFGRLCKEMEPEELNLVWKCLYKGVSKCVTAVSNLHLRRLLSVLVLVVKVDDGQKVSDFRPMLELVLLLVQTYIMPSGLQKSQDYISSVADEILELMLGMLNGLRSHNDMSTISECAVQWVPIFRLQNSSLLRFIRELLQKEHCLLAFRSNVISAINDFMENSLEDAIQLLQSFCEKMQLNVQNVDLVDGRSAEPLARICNHLQGIISDWIGAISDPSQSEEGKLALVWGVVSCYSHMSVVQANPSLLLDLVDSLDQLLTVKSGCIAESQKWAYQSIMGAALSSYNRLCGTSKSGADETDKLLSLAKRYRSSARVLSAVADYLKVNYGSPLEGSSCRIYHPEFEVERMMDSAISFADNLCHSDKEIRVSTLKILCQYKPVGFENSSRDQPGGKKRKIEVPQISSVDTTGSNVLQLLLAIETTPVSIFTSRNIQQLISKIQMDLSAGRISEIYVPLVLNGMFGILNNRFNYLWSPALECLAVLISQHFVLLWDKFVCYLEQCQLQSQALYNQPDTVHGNLSEKPNGLVDCFRMFVNRASDSTPFVTILTLLLQSLQKVPTVIESRSRQFVPLFLKFLGYNTDDCMSVGLFDSHVCKRKEWKAVLKEWLNLLKLMKNPKSFYCSQFLKEVLQNRLLEENDPETQTKVLECLLTWKDDYLMLYEQHLRNLISSRNLREELTTWSLSREAGVIEECHRDDLVPLVIRLLMPKVRKLKGLASRKNASISHRKAILNFIAELEVSELPLFFALLIKPLQIVTKADGSANLFWTSPKGPIGEFQTLPILEYFTLDSIASLPWKKRYGFLHVIDDILGVFDEVRVTPFLDLLMGYVVRVLESCASSLDVAKSSYQDNCNTKSNLLEKNSAPANESLIGISDLKQLKDMRSFCLKIISIVLNKYEDHNFGCEFWNGFFASVKPLIVRLKQEAASSEKPSSLFSCFVVMSRNHKLVALLCREESLVPDIFSILGIKSVSEGVKSCVLKFVENLLSLENELDEEDNPALRVLLSNIEILVSSLCSLFGSDNLTKRKWVKSPGETIKCIFKFLPKYIKDAKLAKDFVDILLLFIKKKAQSSGVYLEVFQVIQSLLPILGNESTPKILRALCPLYVSSELDMRLQVCDLLDAMVASDTSVLSVAKCLRQLNATSAMGLLNYDVILNAYNGINAEFFRSIQVDHALLILSHCVHDMPSEESSFRLCAYTSLVSFIDFSAWILCQGYDNDEELSVMKNSDVCWRKPCIQCIINKFLFKHMGDAMDAAPPGGKREWMDLLRQMVLKLPEASDLKSLMPLCSKDNDADFFNNITHTQMRMRARALSQFSNVVSMSSMSEAIIKKVFVPLFFNMLFNEQDGKAEHMKNACIEALASIAGQMEWESYYALLTKCLNGMCTSLENQKTYIRLVCSILDKFHFSEVSSIEEPKKSLDGVLDSRTSATVCSAILGDCGTTEIQVCLNKVVLPKIQKTLYSDSERVNVNINLAALKLLKLLPGDIMDLHLPSIVHRISNFLKSRLESIRDEARSVLAACLKELGLEFLQFIVKVLQTTLKRGYELHVLGYTVHFILSKCLSNPVSGKLDYCLDDLLAVIENDILGDIAEEKEVEKIAAKMKETRKKKSFETLKLLAQNITFKRYAPKLLAPVTAQLQKHLTQKVKAKLENMLLHIAAGIECNPSVDETDLYTFIYGLIKDNIKDGIGQHENKLNRVNDRRRQIDAKSVSTGGTVHAGLLCSHLITVFALRILHKRIKVMTQDETDGHVLSLLDPFVMLLSDCLSSKYEDILSVSLECLTVLVRLPLPSLDSQVERVKITLLEIAQNSVNSTSPLMQSCLTLLTVLLRSTKITLTADQMHFLIQLPVFIDFERSPSPVALSLLKGIVNRKLLVPEIYDLVNRVAELMVTSQLESIRKKCSKILLQFLLDYRLSEKRLQQHLDFLLSNLRYEHSTGREAVLEMIHAIIVKFPRSVLDQQSQILFVHLVVCLANDNDSTVRSMSGAAIKKLISSISPNSVNSILEYGLSWYLGGKQQLWGAAAQVLGLLIEAMKKGFHRHIHCILPVTCRILHSSIGAVTDKHVDFSDESVVPLWKEAYYSLVMLEKMFDQFHDLCFSRDLEDIWETICDMLSHPHSWIRSKSDHLIALYFACLTDASRENHPKPLGSYFLMDPSRLYLIAASLCFQLKTELINDADSNLMAQNIVFSVCGFHSLMGQIVCQDSPGFWFTLDQHEKNRFLKAFHLLDSRKGRSMLASLTSSVCEKENQHNADNFRHVLVSLLLRKMGKTAIEMESIQMQTVFNSFGSIMSQIAQDDCPPYALDILLPLYKVCQGFAGKVISDNLMQLAEDTRERIQNILGIQKYLEVYSLIGKNLAAKRGKRKQEERLMAVINPMQNAKRKMRINAKNHANKKRKIKTMKMGRLN